MHDILLNVPDFTTNKTSCGNSSQENWVTEVFPIGLPFPIVQTALANYDTTLKSVWAGWVPTSKWGNAVSWSTLALLGERAASQFTSRSALFTRSGAHPGFLAPQPLWVVFPSLEFASMKKGRWENSAHLFFGRLLRVWGILGALAQQYKRKKTQILTLGRLEKGFKSPSHAFTWQAKQSWWAAVLAGVSTQPK